MFRTLSELRDSVNSLIESQGADALCASFIFTKSDVYYCDCEDNIEDRDVPDDLKEDTLEHIGDADTVYQKVNDMINEYIESNRR